MTLSELACPFGEGVGIEFVRGGKSTERMSYDKLSNRASQAAVRLLGLGIEPGTSVAIGLENTSAGVIAALAAWRAGATLISLPPVPKPPLDGVYRATFTSILGGLGCQLVVGGNRLCSTMEGAIPTVLLEELALPDGNRTDVVSGRPDPAIGLIQFTSGSSGHPRGVAIGAQALANHLEACATAFGYQDDDVVVSWLPVYHDLGLLGGVLTSILRRLPLVLATPDTFIRNPRRWMGLVSDHHATVTGAPDFAYRLTARAARQSASELDLSRVRVCLSGGECVRWSTLTAFAETFEPAGFKWNAMMPVYGMAEATLAVTIPAPGRGPTRSKDGLVHLGSPVPGTIVRFVESDSGVPVLQVGGEFLMAGYVDEHGLHTDTATAGWFTTSDTGHVDSGEICIQGRVDEVVSFRGRNVCAEDVEMAIMSLLSETIAAVGAYRLIDGTSFGVAAELVDRINAEPDRVAIEIRSAVAKLVGLPVAQVTVLRARSLPLTTSGKVKRSECRKMTSDGMWPERRVLATLQ